MTDFPMINGKSYDFSALESSAPLVGIFREITEFNYSHNVEPGELRADVPWVVATARGQYSAEGSFTISKQGHIWLVQKLTELAQGAGYMDYEFPIQAIYSRTGMPTIKDSLWDCRLIGDDASNATGPDPSLVSCTLFVKAIYPNGNKPFGDMPWTA
jgi:hypothetical protein